jgi:ABC-type transport system involved in cytochrome c biogenesis permease subunit
MNSQELNSIMLYIHPPLAIIGYVFIFLFAILLIKKQYSQKTTTLVGVSLWLFTFLGLLTGMIWAQLAWGSYWSWDPKEIMTLVLFLTTSAGQTAYFEKKYAATKWIAIIACVLTIITASSSFIITGLHTFV